MDSKVVKKKEKKPSVVMQISNKQEDGLWQTVKKSVKNSKFIENLFRKQLKKQLESNNMNTEIIQTHYFGGLRDTFNLEIILENDKMVTIICNSNMTKKEKDSNPHSVKSISRANSLGHSLAGEFGINGKLVYEATWPKNRDRTNGIEYDNIPRAKVESLIEEENSKSVIVFSIPKDNGASILKVKYSKQNTDAILEFPAANCISTGLNMDRPLVEKDVELAVEKIIALVQKQEMALGFIETYKQMIFDSTSEIIKSEYGED